MLRGNRRVPSDFVCCRRAAGRRSRQLATADDRSVCQQVTGDDAIAACTRMLALNPRNANAYVVRGAAYFRRGDYGHAISNYDQAIRLDPKCTNAYGPGRRGVRSWARTAGFGIGASRQLI